MVWVAWSSDFDRCFSNFCTGETFFVSFPPAVLFLRAFPPIFRFRDFPPSTDPCRCRPRARYPLLPPSLWSSCRYPSLLTSPPKSALHFTTCRLLCASFNVGSSPPVTLTVLGELVVPKSHGPLPICLGWTRLDTRYADCCVSSVAGFSPSTPPNSFSFYSPPPPDFPSPR